MTGSSAGNDNGSKTIEINLILNILLTVSNIAVPFITYPYVTRILGPEGVGRVTFASSIVEYFGMFASLGIPVYGIRAAANVRHDEKKLGRLVNELLLLNFVTALMSFTSLYICIAFVPRFSSDSLLYVILSSQLIFTTFGVEWLYKGIEEYAYITKRSLMFKVIAMVFMFLMVRDRDDYPLYALALVISNYLSLLINFFNVRKHADISEKINVRDVIVHIKPVLVFFAMAAATLVYTNLDTVMLGLMKGDTEVGYYSSAVKIKGALTGVVCALGAVVLPRLTLYINSGDKKAFSDLIRKSVNVVFMMAIPFIVYFTMYVYDCIIFLSGVEFKPSIVPMVISMPIILLVGMSNVFGIQMLVPLGKEKYVVISEIAGGATDIILNALLIPSFGCRGAAIGTLAAEFVVMTVQFAALGEYRKGVFGGIRIMPIILSTAVAGVAAYVIKLFNIDLKFELILSGIVFYAIYAVIMYSLVIKKEGLF